MKFSIITAEKKKNLYIAWASFRNGLLQLSLMLWRGPALGHQSIRFRKNIRS